MRPKRGELPALLERLNESVGVSARRLFAQQATPSQLLQRSQSELRRLLPELCAFVESLPAAASGIPASLVRRAFRHPDAQWLSRSARQSGISALLCQQLLRLARQQDGDEGNKTLQWSVAELAARVLLDALLSPCAQRLGQAPDACRWRPMKDKPRFHAMTCFPVWSTLLPFAALLALRYPELFQRVLAEYPPPLDKKGHRVNCDFAQVTGVWRLVEEVNRGDKQKQETVTQVMTSLLQFASDKLLVGSQIAKEEAPHLDDQLLEKFFTGLQGFSFNCWRGDAVIKPALFDAIRDALVGLESRAVKENEVPHRIAVFTAVGSMLVRNLAADVVSMLIERIGDTSREVQSSMLTFLVGFCAHLDLVPVSSVLGVLDLLMTSYKAASEDETQRQRRLELLFYILYVALHRCQAVDRLRKEVSSDAAAVKEVLAQFQRRLCSEVVYEDFYVAAPVHWTARVWKHWVFLTDDDVQAFVSDTHDNDHETEEEFKNRVARWRACEALVAFRPSSFALFTQMKALLKPHLISSSPLTDVADENGFALQARKRRRTGDTVKNSVDPDKLERSFDVLLLPDVMERVCSFMSAKRLCRMALVCRDFAEVSHRPTLWRSLYLRMGVSVVKIKRGVLPAAPVECSHGDSYEHDWRRLYQSRWKVLRRLRRTQRRTIEAAQSTDRGTEAATSPGNMSAFIPQICVHCGCNQVFKTASDRDAHLTRHRKFTCSEHSCRASLLGAHKFKQHMRAHTKPAETEPAAADADANAVTGTASRLLCGYKGCKKTYASAARLATHRRKKNHFDSSSDTSDAD